MSNDLLMVKDESKKHNHVDEKIAQLLHESLDFQHACRTFICQIMWIS